MDSTLRQVGATGKQLRFSCLLRFRKNSTHFFLRISNRSRRSVVPALRTRGTSVTRDLPSLRFVAARHTDSSRVRTAFARINSPQLHPIGSPLRVHIPLPVIFYVPLEKCVKAQSREISCTFRAIFGQLGDILHACPPETKGEKEFPLTVRAGSTALKIYRERKPSGDYFRLVYYLGGKRHRLNFNSLDAAKREAFAKVAQLSRGDVDAVQLNGRDRQTYGRALDALKSTGVALDAAATEYAQAARTLAGRSLLDAVNFYMRHGATEFLGGWYRTRL